MHALQASPYRGSSPAVLVALAGIAAIGFAWGPSPVRAERPADAARRAGLRVLESRHLTLVTDRAERADDGVEDLPRLFDEAVAGWLRHYGLDPAAHREWRALGCLVVDRERFRAAGLLPADTPPFTNGFCSDNRFWMMDQSNPAYRRHLLMHEGVHAFTLTVLRLDTQPWYTEGIAELLATHRLDATTGTPRLVATPMPADAADVEQLGRIERLRAARAAGNAPSLDDVFATPGALHHELSAYASNWAAVAMLSLHPRYAERFTTAERAGLDAGFTPRLIEADGWDQALATRDFDAFTDDIDYGYDFARSAIDWSSGAPLVDRRTLRVAADRGWQNAACTLAKEQRCSFTATGRISLGECSDRRLDSEPEGISLRWYRGRPVGRLLAAQWVGSPADGGRPRFVVLAEGGEGTFQAATDGPLYFKINESPGDLADNTGEFAIAVAPRQ